MQKGGYVTVAKNCVPAKGVFAHSSHQSFLVKYFSTSTDRALI